MSSASPSYRRVPQQETTGNASGDGTLEANVTRSRGERLQDKLIARELIPILIQRNVFSYC